MLLSYSQRIESWWAILKHFRLAWWLEKLKVGMDYLLTLNVVYSQELHDEGLYDPGNDMNRYSYVQL